MKIILESRVLNGYVYLGCVCVDIETILEEYTTDC